MAVNYNKYATEREFAMTVKYWTNSLAWERRHTLLKPFFCFYSHRVNTCTVCVWQRVHLHVFLKFMWAAVFNAITYMSKTAITYSFQSSRTSVWEDVKLLSLVLPNVSLQRYLTVVQHESARCIPEQSWTTRHTKSHHLQLQQPHAPR